MIIEPALRIIELLLQIVLKAMEGQPPAVREQLWQWYVEDMKRWRKLFRLDEDPT